jgi:ABC-type branched-subunit amino acid transport system ATPase component
VTGAPVLAVRGLTRRFGGVTAVAELDLEARDGEVLGVIGPNGAGKSTLVGLISGALAPSAGSISLAGADITGRDAAHRARLGIGRTHQIPRPFARMTVLENLMLAAGSVTGRHRAAQRRAECCQILDRCGLSGVADRPAGGLTLLRRKRLELARAMALRPRLIMLDEIGAGLVESETRELIELIRQLRGECAAMLLIEHVMEVITACCDRVAVLDFGKLIALGPTREVLADPTVAAVYLGTAAADQSTGSAAAQAGENVEAHQDATAGAGMGAVRISDRTVRSLVDVAAPDGTGPLLAVDGLTVDYGGLRALRDVSLTVGAGETVTLLGANGAGKTTFAHAIAGALPLTAGRVRFDGRDITGLRPDRVTALGLAQCLEGRRIFGSLTVEENLVVGAGPAAAPARRERLDAVYSIFPILADRRRHSGVAMSGGQQQMLAIGRALMCAPKLLVLDEVSLGLAPIAVDRLYEALAAIQASGVAMVLVEQNIARGLSLAQRGYVLSQGEVALAGRSDEISRDPALAALYVGRADAGRADDS